MIVLVVSCWMNKVWKYGVSVFVVVLEVEKNENEIRVKSSIWKNVMVKYL